MDSESSIIMVSKKEFLLFHNIDRELFKILVINLSRDPIESMQILALWLWLERVGFRGMVKKILFLPHTMINEAANEGVACLQCINNRIISSLFEGNGIPLLCSLVNKEISLEILYENRMRAVQGMQKIMHDVCFRALIDIVHQVEMREPTKGMEVLLGSKNHICFGSIEPSKKGINEVKGVESSTTPQNEVPGNY